MHTNIVHRVGQKGVKLFGSFISFPHMTGAFYSKYIYQLQ